MLMLARTYKYGSQVLVNLFYKNVVVHKRLLGDEKVVVIELGKKAENYEDMIKRNPKDFELGGDGPNAYHHYIGKNIRKATLDDVFECDQNFVYYLQEKDFELKEYQDCLESRIQEMFKPLRAAVEAKGEGRRDALKSFCDIWQKFEMVFNGLNNESMREHAKLLEKYEKKLMKESLGLAPAEMFEVAARMQTWEVKYAMGVMAIKKVLQEKDPSQVLWGIMHKAFGDHRYAGLFSAYHGDTEIDIKLRHAFRFPQNLKGATIELQSMVEVDAMTLEGLPKDAKFIGPVRLGKKALYDPERKIYLYGDKKLKQRVIKKGGSVNKYGNTLVLRSDDVDTDMVLMERIDAYACTNPAMISEIKNRSGRSFKVDRSYIDRIKKDYRVGRELADIVLEELFGIDPDIARGLYRSARRRRQG